MASALKKHEVEPPVGIRREYIVLGAPGWPDGIRPTPNTLEDARHSARAKNGYVAWRYTSEWVRIPPPA
jgi:hypothetical protein